MAYAGELAVEALAMAKSHLKEGVTEKQISRLIRLFFVDHGADIAFEPIVAFGDHNAIPHHVCSDRALEKGHFVMIDLGAKLDRYCSDMTRSFFFKEVGNEEVKRMWNLTYEAFNLAKDLLKTSVSCHELDRRVREFFKEKAVEERFTHSLGHGIGLRVHESPRIRADLSSDYVLETGAVITIEPGLYLSSIGGVRLEDTLVVNEKGAVSLTPSPFELVYTPNE
jgi:Xaa-Pro aminopeptidase